MPNIEQGVEIPEEQGTRVLVTAETPFTPEAYAELAPITTPAEQQVGSLVEQLRRARARKIEVRHWSMSDSEREAIAAREEAVNSVRRARAEVLEEVLVMLGQEEVVRQVLPTNDYPYLDRRYRG